MEPKKNPAYDVHRHRSILFTIGLITSLLIAIAAFEWGLEVRSETRCRFPVAEDVYAYIIPTEHVYEKALPKPKPLPVVPATIITVADASMITSEAQEAERRDESVNGDIIIPTIVIPGEKYDEPFIYVDKMPVPVGGLKNFYAIQKANLKYPKIAARRGVEGKVFVEFVINEEGEPEGFRILKAIGSGCDEEAIRVLKLVRWEPGKQRGIPVKVRMIQSVYFKLDQ